MILLKLCRNTLLRFLLVLVIISSLNAPLAFCQETEDSQVFIAGFNAFQQKDYASSIEKMSEVLQKFPDTPLRDVSLFWLSRSYYKAGNHQEAARYLSQFSKEYPDNPLKSTVEDELIGLVARYEKGEKLPVGLPPVKKPDLVAIRNATIEKEKIAAAKAEEAKAAAKAAEMARDAAIRQAEENAAAERKERDRIAAVRVEQERIAAEKIEVEKLAAAESARRAVIKQAEEQAASKKKEQERVAAFEAEQKRIAFETAAKESAEKQRIAAAKAEAALRAEAAAETRRIAVEKAEQERRAQTLAEKERIARAEAELTRMNSLNAENERKAAAEKADRERIALRKAEEARQAAAAAESSRIASLKAEEERKRAETIAKEAENSRRAVQKAEEDRLAAQKHAEENARITKSAYREKAIGQYKAIIEKFPASTAAATAVVKLRELGIAVALPAQVAEVPLAENAQVFRLEVAQFAGFEFNLLARPEAFIVGRPNAVPFEVTNRGNGTDSFYLESAFPAEFRVSFASAAAPGTTISQTPDLAPNETFKGVINLTIPPGSIDGLRSTYPVKAASRLMSEASQSREVRLIASAPLLRAVLRTEKIRPVPGDTVVYRVAILNVGSTVAQDVTLRLNFPPQFEPVDYSAAGFRQEMKSALVLDGLQIKSGESRELGVSFQLKDDSLAGQELSTRAELINNQLKTSAVFVSNMSAVEPQRSLTVSAGSARIVAIPGQLITVPFVVTNTGNVREKFKISSTIAGTGEAVVFSDLNRDGIRQTSEPIANEIGPLAPREEATVAVEFRTPRTATDGSHGSIRISCVSEGDPARSASESTELIYSRPVVKMAMAGRDGRLKPGDVASFDLTITNTGSNLARVVELQSAWPEQLELIAADPATSTVNNGTVIWRFKEMGAAEKRSIKVSFRVKPGTGVGTALNVKNILNYEDQLGNRY